MGAVKMNREELINALLGIRPLIIAKEELDILSDQQLNDIYKNNKFNSYYETIMKQQKISAINYVYENYFTLAELYSLAEEEFNDLYLRAIKMTQEEFDKILSTGLEEFSKRAKEEENAEYDSFTKEEKIIASGLLIPADLLTEEEYTKQSILSRIHEISEEIKELRKDNENTEELIANETNYMARTELREDIHSNNLRIWKLEDELKKLMNIKDTENFGRRHN